MVYLFNTFKHEKFSFLHIAPIWIVLAISITLITSCSHPVESNDSAGVFIEQPLNSTEISKPAAIKPNAEPTPAFSPTNTGSESPQRLSLATITITPSPSPFPTWTSSPTHIPLPTVIPTWTALPDPTNTPMPIPTYTPPPQEEGAPQENDHYWLERPIASEYTNWTDRIYPYGSTRGGLYPTHHGVEFFNPVGVPILAAGDGVAIVAGSDDVFIYGPKADFYGNLVVIQHDEVYHDQPLYTLYGHMSKVLVSEGQRVAAGEVIGQVGGTGVANGGAHLHFEVRVGDNQYGMTRNPELWLRPFPGWGTLAGQLLWPDGSYIYGAAILVDRIDDPSRFTNRTLYTYADNEVNPDEVWGENFTSPDLEPGPYSVIFRDSELNVLVQKVVWIYPDQTSFVTIQLDVSPPPEE